MRELLGVSGLTDWPYTVTVYANTGLCRLTYLGIPIACLRLTSGTTLDRLYSLTNKHTCLAELITGKCPGTVVTH